MDSRAEKKAMVATDESASRLSIFKSKDPSEDMFYSTKQLKRGVSKEFKTNDRTAVQALFEISIAIPKHRKISLLKEIKEKTPIRQLDTQEAKIKKQRKRLDIKRVVEIKKRDSETKVVISKKESSFDAEQILYNARTRLEQHYEHIKRILHDQDNYLYNLYLDNSKVEIMLEEQVSNVNVPHLKITKVTTPDISKPTDVTQFGGKRVMVEDVASDASLTNDFYDYTKAPQTERHFLDMARRKASWADRRSFAPRSISGSGFGGHRASTVGAGVRPSTAVPASGTVHAKASFIHDGRRSSMATQSMSLNTQMQLYDPLGGRRYSYGVPSGIDRGARKDSYFPAETESMKGISGVSRKTIQYMNSKNVAKKDSQMQSKKNLDSYIWYLIDPIAKNKYDLFLQKSLVGPIKSESNDSLLHTKLPPRIH